MHCKEPIPKIGNKYSQKRNCTATVQFSHSCVCERFIYPTINLPFLLRKYVDRSWEYIEIDLRHMNVEIWTEAAQFPEKENINGIFVAVYSLLYLD
jgi:hypothetical protein